MTTRSKVAIVRCPDYHASSLQAAMARLVTLIGQFPDASGPNRSVFVKINHLGNHPVSRAVNTNPELLSRFVATLDKEHTTVTVGDTLDSHSTTPFQTSGFASTCARDNIDLINLAGLPSRGISVPGCEVLPVVPIPRIVADAQWRVTIPKLKTHTLTLMTGAIKNSYGFLPFALRTELHRRFLVPEEFGRAVVDVFAAAPPQFALMDAIDALEGSGPSAGGRPRHLGLLLASKDAVALDAVGSAIMGLDPFDVPTTRIAHQRSLGVGRLEEIDIVGESLEDVRCPDFALPTSAISLTGFINRFPRPMVSMLSTLAKPLRLWPRVSLSRCTGCALCLHHCPKGAIVMRAGKALINYDECISCFCCQEFCQSDAIRPVRSLPGRVVLTVLRSGRRLKRGLLPPRQR